MPGWLFPLLFGLGFAGIGSAVAAGSMRRGREQRRVLATAPRVPGVITGVHWIHGGEDPIRVPVIAFRTLEGQEVQSWPSGGVTNRMFRPGTPVTVAYDPADPRTIYTDANGSMGGTAWIGLLIGGFFAVIGVVVTVVTILVVMNMGLVA